MGSASKNRYDLTIERYKGNTFIMAAVSGHASTSFRGYHPDQTGMDFEQQLMQISPVSESIVYGEALLSCEEPLFAQDPLNREWSLLSCFS